MGSAVRLCPGSYGPVCTGDGDAFSPPHMLLPVIGPLPCGSGGSAFGVLPGAGRILKPLNIPRFVLHVFVTPAVCVVRLEIARSARFARALTITPIAAGCMRGSCAHGFCAYNGVRRAGLFACGSCGRMTVPPLRQYGPAG